MRRRSVEFLAKWLAAESSGSIPEAERALAALFQLLPAASPRRDLADRVLADLGFGRAPMPLRTPWGLRLAVAASFVLVTLSIPWLPAMLFALPTSVGSVVGGVADGAVAATALLLRAFSAWRVLAAVSDKAALVLATPQMMSIVLLMSLVGAATLVTLRHPTLPHRSSVHVDSI